MTIKYSGTLTSSEREKGAFSSNKIIRVIFLKLNLKLTLSGTLILSLFNLVFMSEDCRQMLEGHVTNEVLGNNIFYFFGSDTRK